eukprot:3363740-Pleurochrysis_carterae.AAC.1
MAVIHSALRFCFSNSRVKYCTSTLASSGASAGRSSSMRWKRCTYTITGKKGTPCALDARRALCRASSLSSCTADHVLP